MNVFISWSGERSKRVALLLDEWLQCVLQRVKPFMSSKDIDRGSLWFSEINDQLKNTTIGVICLTKENINKPWILFESGALLKGLSSNRVCTFLIDLQTSDIGDPLAQFNHTLPNKEGVWSLIQTLNNGDIENRIGEKILDRIFETYWPQFELEFKKIIEDTVEGKAIKKKDEDSEILYEILNSVRFMDKRIRNLEYEKKQENYYMNDKIEFLIKDILNSCKKHFSDRNEAAEYVIEMLNKKYNTFSNENSKNKYDYNSIIDIVGKYI